MEKKKLEMLIGSIFVFLIFISAYASFSSPVSNNFGNRTNQSKTKVQTFLVSGNVNGVIVNYTDSASVYLNNSKYNYTSIVENTLNSYEQNNYIIDYTNGSKSNSFDILLQNISAYSLQQKLANITNNNIVCNSTAILLIPSRITLQYGSQSITVFLPNKTTKAVPISPLLPIGTNIPVHINAFVTKQGYVYNNNISISLLH